jgi:hypothetical protein
VISYQKRGEIMDMYKITFCDNFGFGSIEIEGYENMVLTMDNLRRTEDVYDIEASILYEIE